MATEFDLTPIVQESAPEEFVLNSVPQYPVPQGAIKESRAERYDFALALDSPGLDKIHEYIQSGTESMLREKQAFLDDQRRSLSAQEAVASRLGEIRQTRPVTQADLQEVLGQAASATATSAVPSTIMEERVAARGLEGTGVSSKEPAGEYFIRQMAITQLIKTKREEAMAAYEKQSGPGAALDFALTMVPFYSQYKQTNLMGPPGSWWAGDNIEEQQAYLRSLPPAQAERALKEAVDYLIGSNPGLAVQFMEKLDAGGTGATFIDNLFTGVDVASLTPVGLAAKGIKAPVATAKGLASSAAGITSQSTLALKNTALALSQGFVPKQSALLSAVGKSPAAALQDVTNQYRVLAANRAGSTVQSWNELEGRAHLLFNPQAAIKDAINVGYTPEAAQRMLEAAETQSAALLEAGIDLQNINRVIPGTPEYEALIDATYRLAQDHYNFSAGHVLGVTPSMNAENALTNSTHLKIILGTKNGVPFKNKPSMDSSLRRMGVREYNAVEVAPNEWVGEITKVVNEGDLIYRDSLRTALRNTASNERAPESGVNRLLGKVRPRDAVMPTDVVIDFKKTAYAGQKLANVSQAVIEDSLARMPRSLRKDSAQKLEQFREYQRDLYSLNTKSRGIYSNDIAELTTDWLNYFGKRPTEEEAVAYFTNNRVEQMQYLVHNFNTLRGKQSQGFELLGFNEFFPKRKAPSVEGRFIQSIPWNKTKDDGTIVVMPSNPQGKPMTTRLRGATQQEVTGIDQLITGKGYKVYELTNDGAARFRADYGIPGNDFIRYVVAKDAETSPLPMTQVPYKPGGHIDYKHEYIASQPKLSVNAYANGSQYADYLGDLNLFSARSLDEANAHAKALEQARQMRNNGLPDAQIDNYLSANSPFTLRELEAMERRGQFSWRDEIVVRKKGQATIEANPSIKERFETQGIVFTDHQASVLNPLGDAVNRRYSLEREDGLRTIVESNGSLHFELSPVLDPTTVLDKSNRLVFGGRYTDDLKQKTAIRYVAQFGDLLEGDAYRHNLYPIEALRDAKIKQGMDPKRVAAAKNYRASALAFLDTRTALDDVVERFKEAGLNYAFKSKNPERIGDVVEWAAERDPLAALRKFTMIKNMGFWNPKQWFMQAQGVSSIAAIEGVDEAMRGMALGWLMRPMTLTSRDDIAKLLSAKAPQFGMTREHFEEMYKSALSSNYTRVGQEYDFLDSMSTSTVSRGGLTKMADASLAPFKMGERVVRLTSWAVAYNKWRKANPTAVYNQAAKDWVLNRADLLANNMSKGSNAALQEGLMKTPTQFWSYQARIMDLLWGKRLEPMEKARLLFTQSLLYGVPVGTIGMAAGALVQPHGEVRETAFNAGIDPNDNIFSKAFFDGIPQAALYFVTGADPSLANTFGANGLSFVEEILFKDDSNPVINALTGASGTAIRDVLQAVSPSVEALIHTLSPSGGNIELDLGDFSNVLDAIATTKNIHKAWVMYNIGTYYSKDQSRKVFETQHNATYAAFLGLLGTIPQEVQDKYTKDEWIKAQQDVQAKARASMRREYMKAYEAGVSLEDQAKYLRSATAIGIAGGLTMEQRRHEMRTALRNIGTPQVNQMDERIKNLNQEQRDMYYKKLFGTRGN